MRFPDPLWHGLEGGVKSGALPANLHLSSVCSGLQAAQQHVGCPSPPPPPEPCQEGSPRSDAPGKAFTSRLNVTPRKRRLFQAGRQSAPSAGAARRRPNCFPRGSETSRSRSLTPGAAVTLPAHRRRGGHWERGRHRPAPPRCGAAGPSPGRAGAKRAPFRRRGAVRPAAGR